MKKNYIVMSLEVALGADMMHKSLRFLPLEITMARKSSERM